MTQELRDFLKNVTIKQAMVSSENYAMTGNYTLNFWRVCMQLIVKIFFSTLEWGRGVGYFGFGWLLFWVGLVFGGVLFVLGGVFLFFFICYAVVITGLY